MPPQPNRLHNSAEHELWPAHLLRAHSSADARSIALSNWVLRHKRSGRYLAAVSSCGGVTALPPVLHRDRITAAAAKLLAATERANPAVALPMHALERRLQALGLDADAYAASSGLSVVAEPSWLQFAGFDRYRRPLWLAAEAAKAWSLMQAAARADGVLLDAISGYRSHDYQLGIFARKRARGLSVEDILAVNAAPGFSEHHSGAALDIGTPGELPAEESFETTDAFRWLQSHAGDFGFRMSYPRDNPHGIVYEPWHWRWWPMID